MHDRVPGPDPRRAAVNRRQRDETSNAPLTPGKGPGAPALASPNAARVAQLASTMQASPSVHRQQAVAVMMNGGPRVAALRQLVGGLHAGSGQLQRKHRRDPRAELRHRENTVEPLPIERADAACVPGTGVLQGVFLDIESTNFKGYIKEQQGKQAAARENVERIDSGFTTVGLEHEFTQTVGENQLAGISHLELAKSTPLPYTNLPFILETDAANALELVSPPFLVKTLPDTFIPDPADVETIDELIRADLLQLSKTETIGKLVKGFRDLGLDFTAVKALKIERKNVSHKSAPKDYSQAEHGNLSFDTLENIEIKPTEKGGGITSQVNFATDAATLDRLQKVNQEEKLKKKEDNKDPGFNPKAIIATLEGQIRQLVDQTGIAFDTEGLKIFANQLARTLAGQFAVPAIQAVRRIQQDIFVKHGPASGSGEAATFRLSAYLSSAVKDVHGVWIKDSLMNIGLGILNKDDWKKVKHLLVDHSFREGIDTLTLPKFTNINGFENKLEAGNALIDKMLGQAKKLILEVLSTMVQQIVLIKQDPRPSTSLAIVPVEEVGFMEHNPGMIGPRQDTFIDPRKAQLPRAGRRLHVAETRKEGIESLIELGLQSASGPTFSRLTLQQSRRQLRTQLQEQETSIAGLEMKVNRLRAERVVSAKKLEGNTKELAALQHTYDAALSELQAAQREEQPLKNISEPPTEPVEPKKPEMSLKEKKLRAGLGKKLEKLRDTVERNKIAAKKAETMVREAELSLKDLSMKHESTFKKLEEVDARLRSK